MIRILAITKDLKPIYNLSLEELSKYDLSWFWVDFSVPSQEEIKFLEKNFHFHHLSIEDCLFSLNSPKLDYYDNYNFVILNALNQENLDPIEVSLFVSDNYIVSYHSIELNEIDEAWKRAIMNEKDWNKGSTYIAHQILDKVVDQFFPAIYKIEDRINNIESNIEGQSLHRLIDEVFKIRGDLIKLRKIINSMRDLVYRIVNSERLYGFKEHKLYFSDIHDHLLKLSSMIESSREMTSDMRDNYLSINSTRMNKNMMVLTVITTIFIPLTFIVGVYGMNFEYMPELSWKYGYPGVLLVMAIIGIVMFYWFKRKGWFDI
ncbi:magnesium transport protein CorA [Clostridium polyendosporum]|uniref:Magnesium transport protein CorA n=1 Tax=Clostridium polyendosporum TaxID=69208 RepID=A0A919RYM0_9CLOT|nr:magnesium/cobalt transporter CorA [Clostridium polyendosporum]GIM28121.1 magnesium transport protein CorA [Clostridium polyendosporum]